MSLKIIDSAAILDSIIKNNKYKFVMEFAAKWSFPCRAVSKNVKRICKELSSVDIFLIDVENEDFKEALKTYSICVVPTFLLFEGGEFKRKLCGPSSRGRLRNFIEKE